ncbi:MAG: ABC transporter permease, partial [Solirubrobacteraceae bacterium]
MSLQSSARSQVSDAVVGFADAVVTVLAQVGDFTTFAGRTLGAIPMTLRLYHREVLRQLKDIAWGSGALIVGGGTIGVMVLLALSA